MRVSSGLGTLCSVFSIKSNISIDEALLTALRRAMLHVIAGRRQDILRLLLEKKDGLTVDQIAAELGVTRSAARDHVRSMERDELVAPSLTPIPTGGRPGTAYTLTDQGHALFPKNYDGLARLLLESLVARLGRGEAEKELKALGKRL